MGFQTHCCVRETFGIRSNFRLMAIRLRLAATTRLRNIRNWGQAPFRPARSSPLLRLNRAIG